MSARPPPASVSRLEARDVAGALRLSTHAGWNQLEADWLRLMKLWPDSCFAVRDDRGEVIATSTLAHYGGIGWVGMVLVDEALRGKGLGGLVFGAALGAGDGLEHVGLDATDLGMPVYLKHGFAPQVEINRWGSNVIRESTAPPRSSRPARDADWPAILELDRAATGVDRSALLRAMSREAGVHVRVAEQSGRLDGFGLARPGRVAGQIGPLVASSLASATHLAASLCADLAESGAGRVFIDVLGKVRDDGFTSWLSGENFSVLRRLTRMAKPARSVPLLAGPHVFATAALELG